MEICSDSDNSGKVSIVVVYNIQLTVAYFDKLTLMSCGNIVSDRTPIYVLTVQCLSPSTNSRSQ